MNTKRIFRIFFFSYCTLIIANFLFITISECYINPLKKTLLEGWNLSEWLINYNDGFVRRGLWGEGLLYLYNCYNLDIIQNIYLITIISTIALILFTIYFFWKKGLSVFLLPSILFFGSYTMYSITSFRRDALMLLLIFLALYFYKKWIEGEKKRWIYYILLSLTGIFVILTHEASFFCFVPFIAFDHYVRNKNRLLVQRAASTVFFILPILLTMGCACIFKGNEEIANNIWNSYTPYFHEKFGEMLPIGDGVEALSWSTGQAIRLHVRLNFLILLPGNIPSVFAWCIIFFLAFYLMMNVNKIRLFEHERENIDNEHLATILFIQLAGMSPLFAVLSCDYGRLFVYWSLTSFYIFAHFGKEVYPVFSTASKKINKIYNKNLFRTTWFYVMVSITIVLPFWGFKDPLRTSVIGNIIYLIDSII
ncbi:MAG: hypothetical protein IJ436_00865 [Bacteroidaceae bacterium]|nr:hypothetical protein [Bacteroidaceae bacterium]